VNFTGDAGENDARLLVDEIRTCTCEVPADVTAVSELLAVFFVNLKNSLNEGFLSVPQSVQDITRRLPLQEATIFYFKSIVYLPFMNEIWPNLKLYYRKRPSVINYLLPSHNSVSSDLIIVQQDATYSVYYISVGSSTCFGVDTHHQELVQL